MSQFTEAEDHIIMENPDMTAKALMALLPDHTWNQIRNRRDKLRERLAETDRTGPWTDEEIAWLKSMVRRRVQRMTIAKAMNRSLRQVREKIEVLELSGRARNDKLPGLKQDWPDLGPNAFKNYKLQPEGRYMGLRPQDRTLAGVGRY